MTQLLLSSRGAVCLARFSEREEVERDLVAEYSVIEAIASLLRLAGSVLVEARALLNAANNFGAERCRSSSGDGIVNTAERQAKRLFTPRHEALP